MRRVLFLLVLTAFTSGAWRAQAQEVKADVPLSVVRVNVTNQSWDFGRPWGKRPPFSRRAIGTVLSGNRVLVTAELVANANFVELETAEGGQKVPATVEVVDYESNLALLKADDAAFLKPLKPLEVAAANVGDMLSVWQLESNGALLVTQATMTTAEVTRYPTDDSPLLIYRLTTPLQFRDSSFTLPVVKGGKLVGMVMRYDNTTNNADVLPAPVIEHFLKDAAKQPYEGFPRVGITSSPTRDPQFRRYLELNGTTGGVYIADTLRDSPAAKAGIEKGDVLLAINGLAVDQDGNYKDPDYGKIGISHYFSTRHYVGDVVKFTIFRKGEKKDLNVTLARRTVESYVIEPYVIDRAPKFYVLGGLVLSELSRQYLKEYGTDWQKKAPEQFVYFDKQQNELFKDGPKKLVFLNRVLPSDLTVGYEDLTQLIVTKVNGVRLEAGLSDLPAALAKAENGLHKIEFDGEPGVIYLDAAHATATEKEFQQKYRLPTLQRIE